MTIINWKKIHNRHQAVNILRQYCLFEEVVQHVFNGIKKFSNPINQTHADSCMRLINYIARKNQGKTVLTLLLATFANDHKILHWHVTLNNVSINRYIQFWNILNRNYIWYRRQKSGVIIINGACNNCESRTCIVNLNKLND